MKKMLIATLLAAGALLAITPAAAFAVDYPAGDVPPTSGEPGAALRFNIQTGQATTPGTVVVDGDDVTTDAVTAAAVTHTLTTTADGFAKFGVLLPATATPGSTYKITVNVGPFTRTTSIQVADAQLATEALPAATPTPEPVAAAAGADPAVFWWGGGAAALVAGLIAVFAVRRSRKGKEEPAE
jgi:hypothetical protein